MTQGTSRILLSSALALSAQSAWSDDGQAARDQAAGSEKTATAREQLEADVQAYIEAINRRLAEDLARDLEAIAASRIEIVIAEVPTRG